MRFRPEAKDLCNPIPEGIRQSGYVGMNAAIGLEDYPPGWRVFFNCRAISGAVFSSGILAPLQPMQPHFLPGAQHSKGVPFRVNLFVHQSFVE